MTTNERPFDHIIVIMFENQYRGYVLDNEYFRHLADQGINFGASFGVMHPSQTNYIASIAGELCNVTDDDRPPVLPQRTIVDLVEEAGLTWKAYMDGYTPAAAPWGANLAPQDDFPYVIKHNPFSSFGRILNSEQRWSRVVGEAQFFTDVAAGTLPAFAWFTPDMWNDGHYLRGTTHEPTERAPALVDQAAEWLEWFFGALKFPGPQSTLPAKTLVVVTFDEADYEAAWDAGKKYTYDGPNQIYTVLFADGVDPGVVAAQGYNHYSVLRTIEENFGLGTLAKNDADANWLRFLWGEHFAWNEPVGTPIGVDGATAAAGHGEEVVVVSSDGMDGGLVARTWASGSWSDPVLTGCVTRSGVGLARADDGYVMVFQNESGALVACSSRDGTTWSTPGTPVSGDLSSGCFAVSSCNRGADVMVCFETGGRILSVRRSAGRWDEVIDTGHRTDGSLDLCALGHTLLLVFVEPSSAELRAVSYTTADFNTTTIAPGRYSGPYDDAVVDTWSPTAVPVAHFAAVTMPKTPGEPEPLLQPYRTVGQMVMTELDGVIHLVFPTADDRELVETRYSIAGVLTPKLPISYRASDARTTSNGYGTLAEAGWTTKVPFGSTGGSVVAAAADDRSAVVLVRPEVGDRLQMLTGSY